MRERDREGAGFVCVCVCVCVCAPVCVCKHRFGLIVNIPDQKIRKIQLHTQIRDPCFFS